MISYDVVVLGAGPGGYTAAIRAAQLGAKTAIIEKEHFGGTCLNYGCIPTKTLIKNAEILDLIKKSEAKGITVSDVKLDIKKAIKNKNEVVTQFRNGVQNLVESNGIDVFYGFGEVQKNDIIEIKNHQMDIKISYKNLIIATGSSEWIPPVVGLDHEGVLTSKEILDLEEVPASLLIIGGGVIGTEFATIFNAFGSQVTIVEMQSKLVPNMDKDISKSMLKNMKKKGVALKLKSVLSKVEKCGEKFVATICKGDIEETINADRILVAVGRQPNLAGLEKLELKMDSPFIEVDEMLRTSVKNVFAIGDITGKMQLAHVASSMGIKAVENCMKVPTVMDLSIIPSCIYTLPEIGCVGLTEMQAKEEYDEIIIGKFPLKASGKALAMGDLEGEFKVIADKKTRKIVGAHLFGANATEIVAEMAAYMKMGATLDDVGDTIHAHPTISESVMEAVHAADGHCIHLPKM